MRMQNPFSDDPGGESSGDESRDEAESNGGSADAETETEQHEETPSSEDEASGDDTGGEPESRDDADSGGDSGEVEQKLTAPSVGPHTVIDKPPPEERLDFDRISDEDAMGLDKRREVVGKTYGPTKLRVFATFATFFAVVAALAVGFYFLAQELDAPPKENPDVAPWSAPEAPQQPPKELQ